MPPRFLSATVLATLALAGSAAIAAPPNIVVFLVDDMGIMDTSVPFLTGADGKPERHPLNAFYRTPHMERLAARGIRFNQFSSMSVCSPTRVSLMTGQNAARHRVTNWINPDSNNRGPKGPPDWNWLGLKPGDVTMPMLLRDAGYKTIHVGKGHFAPRGKPGEDPRAIGFDENVGGASFGAPGSYFGAEGFGLTKGNKSHAVPGLDKYHGTETFLTEALTREALARVSSAVGSKKPFFLYFAQYAVHSPFQSDPRFAANYANSGKNPRARAFATLVEGMDKSLGDLMDHLEKLGVAENTIIFFLGDNGSDAPLGDYQAVASSAPLRGGKGSQYEGGTRVPFIASWLKADPANPAQRRWPVPAGAVQRQPAVAHDLFPTVLSIAGAKSPPTHVVDGSPLGQMLAGRKDGSHPATFLMHYPHAPHRCDYFTTWRDGDWKVIYHYFPGKASGGSHYQLFNLNTDPCEKDDLARNQPGELRRLMKGMVAALEGQHAAYPVDAGKPLKPLVP
ncbi:MAG: sulfatase [Planctomycetes bacterium]|nr:sulfatase [Planctomycetota bacterium]